MRKFESCHADQKIKSVTIAMQQNCILASLRLRLMGIRLTVSLRSVG